ncbi:MAG: class I SAM-dependent methyltransferase [Patescibacteria group bacterium]|jgi:SAM-dependent methyltransferase
MELSEYAQMERQEQHYWWHVGRREVLHRVLAVQLPPMGKLEVLDIGCGTGINYIWLKQWGRVIGLDPSPEALAYCREHHAYDELVQADGTNLPFRGQFDLITAFDVLEHTVDDINALQNWHIALKPNGYVFITVPAYQWLFSAHDQALHHRRRYSSRELRDKLEQAGFKIKFISPFFWFTFPIVMLVRLFTKQAKPKTSYVDTPSLLGRYLIGLSGAEAKFLAEGNQLPWGSSILIFAEKDSSS